jgi:hypothetical protein
MRIAIAAIAVLVIVLVVAVLATTLSGPSPQLAPPPAPVIQHRPAPPAPPPALRPEPKPAVVAVGPTGKAVVVRRATTGHQPRRVHRRAAVHRPLPPLPAAVIRLPSAGPGPFPPERNYMSAPGYLRWQAKLATGDWMDHVKAVAAVKAVSE